MVINEKKLTKTLIYSGLYTWYLQQNLSLRSIREKRAHFCLLYLLQELLESNLEKHNYDETSFALSSSFKRAIGCDSKSFKKLFDSYFEHTVEAERCGSIHRANGFKLKKEHLDSIFEYIFQDFSEETSLDYIEIDVDKYEEKVFYKTREGLVSTKKDALLIQGLTRRQEHLLDSVQLNILKSTPVKVDKAYKTNFLIPKGYFKFPVTINRDNLIELIKEKSRDKQTLLFYIKILSSYNKFKFAVYKQASTGRFSGTTNINDKKYKVLINYQGLSKTYRKDIFHGMYEYDIATAAPVVLLQMYKKDFDAPLKHIEVYIKRKRKLRIYFAKLLDGDLEKNIKIVKGTLTSLFFGAKIDNPEHISDSVNATISKVQLRILLKNPIFKGIVEDTKVLFRKIVSVLFVSSNKQRIENANGLRQIFTRKNKNKAVAFVYQGIESLILKHQQDIYADKIALLIHDAIISTEKLDVQELSDNAFKISDGYRVEYEEEII